MRLQKKYGYDYPANLASHHLALVEFGMKATACWLHWLFGPDDQRMVTLYRYSAFSKFTQLPLAERRRCHISTKKKKNYYRVPMRTPAPSGGTDLIVVKPNRSGYSFTAPLSTKKVAAYCCQTQCFSSSTIQSITNECKDSSGITLMVDPHWSALTAVPSSDLQSYRFSPMPIV